MNSKLKLLINYLAKSFLIIGAAILISAFISWSYEILMIRVWIGASITIGLTSWFVCKDDANVLEGEK